MRWYEPEIGERRGVLETKRGGMCAGHGWLVVAKKVGREGKEKELALTDTGSAGKKHVELRLKENEKRRRRKKERRISVFIDCALLSTHPWSHGTPPTRQEACIDPLPNKAGHAFPTCSNLYGKRFTDAIVVSAYYDSSCCIPSSDTHTYTAFLVAIDNGGGGDDDHLLPFPVHILDQMPQGRDRDHELAGLEFSI
jgi:hypothetical protein